MRKIRQTSLYLSWPTNSAIFCPILSLLFSVVSICFTKFLACKDYMPSESDILSLLYQGHPRETAHMHTIGGMATAKGIRDS